ncbi:unnamed protein product, partial [Brachionus calyciflorus]
IDNSDVILFDI